MGVADEHWQEVGDSVKSEPIDKYLPEGKVTMAWQKATIPLGTFLVDVKKLATIAICLIHQTNYLLDQQLRQLEKQFLREGGFTERLYHARQIKKNRQ